MNKNFYAMIHAIIYIACKFHLHNAMGVIFQVIRRQGLNPEMDGHARLLLSQPFAQILNTFIIKYYKNLFVWKKPMYTLAI